jgi:two-component system chemotaxis response regulator CheY
MHENQKKPELYSIGRLSKTVSVSPDTLRYYDEIGLFAPAYTSEDTKYRYYVPEQASTLARIIELKEYGFSLGEIKEMLPYDEVSLIELYQKRYWKLTQDNRRNQEILNKLANKLKRCKEEKIMKSRVLIVDDAEFLRRMVRELLSKADFEIAGEAADGNEAIELYKTLSPDLVIMNIVMPERDGIWALQKIKEIDADANVVMLSALGRQKIVLEALISDAQNFVVKPFMPEVLINAITSALTGEKSLNRETLKLMRDKCANSTQILSQAEINEIISAGYNGKVPKDLMLKLKGNDANSDEKPDYGKPDAEELNSGKAEKEDEILGLLTKLVKGQEEVKELLLRLNEK